MSVCVYLLLVSFQSLIKHKETRLVSIPPTLWMHFQLCRTFYSIVQLKSLSTHDYNRQQLYSIILPGSVSLQCMQKCRLYFSTTTFYHSIPLCILVTQLANRAVRLSTLWSVKKSMYCIACVCGRVLIGVFTASLLVNVQIFYTAVLSCCS